MEYIPGARECEKANKNENGFGKAATRSAGSQHEEAERLGGDKGGEEKAHEPRLAQGCELAQAGSASQVGIDRHRHHLWEDTLGPMVEIGRTEENSSPPLLRCFFGASSP